MLINSVHHRLLSFYVTLMNLTFRAYLLESNNMEICNSSMRDGYIPTIWKCADGVPVLKHTKVLSGLTRTYLK